MWFLFMIELIIVVIIFGIVITTIKVIRKHKFDNLVKIQNLVTPVKAGVNNSLNSIDFDFHWNDEKRTKWTFPDLIKFEDYDFFNTNPKIIVKGNRLIVKTTLLRSCIGLFSGYRCLEINPDNSLLLLKIRSRWLRKYIAQINFKQIHGIEASRVIYPHTEINEFDGYDTSYFGTWKVCLQLEKEGDKIPLFLWETRLTLTDRPSRAYTIADESYEQKIFNIFVSKLNRLTGKKVYRFYNGQSFSD